VKRTFFRSQTCFVMAAPTNITIVRHPRWNVSLV
jgi:hypothetical protein